MTNILPKSTSIKNTRSLFVIRILIIAIYIAGLVGLSFSSTSPIFKYLTPYNLLFSGIILYVFQVEKTKSFYIYLFFCLILGYFSEIIGINTGLIFGDYQYVTTLGTKFWGVPPVIALNWFVLSYCFGYFLVNYSPKKINPIIFSGISAAMMTSFDYIIEPVAIRLDMWKWATQTPPISNYIGWFCISFLMQLVFIKSNFKKENKVAMLLLIMEFSFFCLLWLF